MRRRAFVTLLLALAFAGGWFARDVWQDWTGGNYDLASAECRAMATYSEPPARLGMSVLRKVDGDQWRDCMVGKGYKRKTSKT